MLSNDVCLLDGQTGVAREVLFDRRYHCQLIADATVSHTSCKVSSARERANAEEDRVIFTRRGLSFSLRVWSYSYNYLYPFYFRYKIFLVAFILSPFNDMKNTPELILLIMLLTFQ